ncbi:hypothetical protein CEE36_01330 [candidate division TA06 bacterium B3_TA06]|uniref:Uncharacterized protein n=1 Tax=candidate division TA06 bacterium B3_TA06 TaxID=2012487 RepID=A0A532VB85_UNCT6|nr:MAG: hypothetical protein CEE36_01330 [candidate division TA06 bacterium B3_TA06]
MRNWALLVTLFAIPLVGQVEESLRAEIDSLRVELKETQAQLERTQERFDSLVQFNTPIDLGERLTRAYEAGARNTTIIISVVAGVVGILGVLAAALGFARVGKVRDMLEKARDEIDKSRGELHKAREERFKAAEERGKTEEFTKKTEECASRAEEYLAKIEETMKRLDEVESKVGTLEDKITPEILLGELELGKKNYEEALKHFEKAIEKEPENAYAWFQKGYCLGELGRYEEELKAYEEAIRLRPDYAKAYGNKGVALSNLGRYDEALKVYDEVIRLKPDDAKAYGNRASALGNWGAKLLEAGESEEAMEKFKKAKESAEKAVEFSKGKIGYYNLACAQARLGEYDGALESLKEWKEKTEDFDPAHAWQDPDLAPLQKPPYRKRFIEIVGPPPEGLEKPKAKRKAKPKSTKPKKK